MWQFTRDCLELWPDSVRGVDSPRALCENAKQLKSEEEESTFRSKLTERFQMLRETAAAVKENGLGAALAKFIQATPGAPVTATGYVGTCRGLNCEI